MRRWAWVLLLATLAAGPLRAQTMEVVADTGRLTVGDPVSLRLILRQYEGDALLEPIPHPEAALADGVRLLSVDSMRPVATRLLEARARIAFYRPGKQTIPAFTINFRRGAVILHGTMRSEPVPIEIVPVLDGGGSTLRDIREIEEPALPDPRLIAAGLGVLLLAAWVRRRLGRPVLVLAPALASLDVGVPMPADPFAGALDRLADLEGSGWASDEDLARHVEAVADVLRDYLDRAEGIPARERTTSELLWALPPHLGGAEIRGPTAHLFGSADLVKFARRRPDAAGAAAYLRDARAVLERWHAASPAREALDAVR